MPPAVRRATDHSASGARPVPAQRRARAQLPEWERVGQAEGAEVNRGAGLPQRGLLRALRQCMRHLQTAFAGFFAKTGPGTRTGSQR